MTEEIIIDECFNCKKKKEFADNWRNCKLKCSYKYKRRENDEITRLKQENEKLRKALEEIREIVNGHARPPECDYYGSYKNACKPCALRILKQTEGKIIDKINEVLV